MAFHSLERTLAPFAESGSQSVRDYVMDAGGTPKKGSPFSPQQSARITAIANQLGVARRTVERWVTPRGSEVREVAPQYRGPLQKVLSRARRFPPGFVLRFKGTIQISSDESYRDAGGAGVKVTFKPADARELIETFEKYPPDVSWGAGLAGEFILEVYGSGGYFTEPHRGDPIFEIEGGRSL